MAPASSAAATTTCPVRLPPELPNRLPAAAARAQPRPFVLFFPASFHLLPTTHHNPLRHHCTSATLLPLSILPSITRRGPLLSAISVRASPFASPSATSAPPEPLLPASPGLAAAPVSSGADHDRNRTTASPSSSSALHPLQGTQRPCFTPRVPRLRRPHIIFLSPIDTPCRRVLCALLRQHLIPVAHPHAPST